MAKKATLITLVIVIMLVSIIPAHAWSELPEGATYVNMKWSNRWIYWDTRDSLWVSRDRSPSLLLDNDWNSSSLGSVFGYITPAVIFSDSPLNEPYVLQSSTTYYMEYVIIGTEPLFSYNANPNNYWFVTKDNLGNVFGDWTNSLIHVTDPLNDNYKVPITNVATDTSYSETATGSETYTIRFAFTTNVGVSDMDLSAVMMPCSGYYENVGANMYISAFTAWYDPTGDIFDTVVMEGVNNINNTLNDINDKLDNLFENEKNMLEEKAEQSEEELLAQMHMFNVDSTGDAVKVLYNALTYGGTQSYFYLPATGNVPFLGVQLWDEQFIDITPDYIMDDERLEPLFTCVRFVLYLACAYRIVAVMIALVRLFRGDDSAGETEEVD